MIFILIINDLFIYASLAKPPIALTTWIQKKKGGGGGGSPIFDDIRLFDFSRTRSSSEIPWIERADVLRVFPG